MKVRMGDWEREGMTRARPWSAGVKEAGVRDEPGDR
jgi:hypothetical protein